MATVSQSQFEEVIGREADPITTYAYISTATATTMTLADRWYFFNSTFTNMLASNVTAVDDGIQIDKDGRVEIEFKSAGRSGTTTEIKLGIVKNGTFVDGLLDSGDSILSGSDGPYEADLVGTVSGFGEMHSLWGGDLETNDVIALVISAETAGTVFTPESGAASMHPISKPVS